MRVEPEGRRMPKSWTEWHKNYDDAQSSLARRLKVVRGCVADALAVRDRETTTRILSLCSGDGRDLLPELVNVASDGMEVLLVEQDETLADAARSTAGRMGLSCVRVVTGDAGQTSTFSFCLPVDLLMLCGIFGNVPERDIAATVATTPIMLRSGGIVIWTRGSSEPDLRQRIRRWFHEAGLREIAFKSEPQGFGVGVAQLISPHIDTRPPERLFTFQS
jgi:hypothetical protein